MITVTSPEPDIVPLYIDDAWKDVFVIYFSELPDERKVSIVK